MKNTGDTKIDLGYEITGAVVDITPPMAQEMLDKNIKNNRKTKRAKITAYKEDMLNGKWYITGEAIKFDKNDNLTDGQNRLHACLQAGKSFRTLVVWGVGSAGLLSMDSGAKRSGGDALKISGVAEKHVTGLAAAAAYIDKYRKGGLNSHNISVSNQQVVEIIKKNPNIKNGSLLYGLKASRIIGSQGIAIALHYIFNEHHEKKADEFFAKLSDGTGFMSKEDPIFRLREKLIDDAKSKTQKMHRVYKIHLIIKAWNNFVQDKPVKALGIRDNEKFPEIL